MKICNKELDLNLLLQNLKNGNIDLINIRDIRALENTYIELSNPKVYDELAEILGTYYAYKNDLERVLSLTELFTFSHQQYQSTVLDYFIQNRCSEENIKEYENLDIPYVHEALILYYFNNDDMDSMLRHIDRLPVINNIEACSVACNTLLDIEERKTEAKKYAERLIEFDTNGSMEYILGIIYYDGVGVEPDYIKAKEYFETGIEKENDSCAYWLGYMYEEGIGVEKSIPRAIELYTKAQDLGNEDATEALCDLYIEQENYDEAIKLLKESSSESLKGYVYYKLGELYFYGKGVEKNYETSLEYFEKAHDNNYILSTFYLGYLYGSEFVEQDLDKAIMYYKEGISNGYKELYRDLGLLYSSKLEDFETALKCFEEILKSQNEVSNKIFDVTAFEYFYLKCNTSKEKVDLSKFREFFINVINNRKEQVDPSCDILRLFIDKIDYYLGTKDHYDFINSINLSIEEYGDSARRLSTIKKLLEDNAPVITINSINELTDEFMDSIPKNSIIYTKNYNELTTFGCYELYTYNEMKEIIKELKEIISDIDKDQSEEDIFMQVYIKVLNTVTRIEAKKLINTDNTMHNLCSLITKEAVCMGFSSILSTVFEMLGIECERINAFEHQFIETKINDEWFYSDMSFDIRDKTLDNCLKGENDFCTIIKHKPSPYTNSHKTGNSYSNIKELYKRNLIKLYGEDYLEHDVLQVLGKVKELKNNN